ncbi:MAG TPA: chemotaxis protein CheD [Terriglobales bacterium]|nr:chemotaxis protein CheD [Terriglobales bacterium]
MFNRVLLAEDTTAALMIEEMMLKTPGPAPTLPQEYYPRLAEAGDVPRGRHYLIPGQIFASPQPFAITTIVGSGCALCLWDPSTGIGGACQFVFPDGPEDGLDPARYGNHATAALLQRLLDLGADPGALQAKLYGGAHPKITFGNARECLGHRNVKVAIHFLKEKNIRLVESEVGGTQGRKLVFQTDDGRAWWQRL